MLAFVLGILLVLLEVAMQFEQLTFDQLRFEQPQQITYHSLDNQGKIYCKIDWLTVIFENCSMNQILDWLKLGDCVSDFCAAAFEQSRGYDQVFKFVYNGIMLETSTFNFYGQDMSVMLFDVICPKIRLEISGGALDYLRSIGVDMNSYRFVRPNLPEGGSYHFTRCDFAYDFINYMPEFVDQLIDHIHRNRLPSERVPLASTKGAIGCRVVTGGQKTVYLGSPQSDKMLRVYDKRMEQSDLNTRTYKRPNPYNDPESWFRIEWQTRNRLAHDLTLDQTQDFKSILKIIFDKYAFAEGNGGKNYCRHRQAVDFWLKLFDWHEVEKRIIQNAKYVLCESPEEKLIKSFESVMIRSFILYYTLMGREGLQKAIDRYLASLYSPDQVSERRFLAFLNKLNNLDSVELGSSSPEQGGLWNCCGRLAFKL